MGEEEPVELLPGVGVFAEELDSGGRFCIERHRLHALGLHPGGEIVDLAAPSGRVGAAGSCAGDDDATGHLRVLEGEVEGDVTSHGEAADVGLLDFQVFENAVEVVDGVLLGVGLGVGGDVGGWIASAVVGDGEVGPGEEVDLGVPALPAARVFVDEDDGKSLATGLRSEGLGR